MTCLDITMEEKWTYSWGLGSEGAKIPPKNMWGHFLEQMPFEGRRRWSANAKRLFIGTLFVDVDSCLYLSRRLEADAFAGAGAGADADADGRYYSVVLPVAVYLGMIVVSGSYLMYL